MMNQECSSHTEHCKLSFYYAGMGIKLSSFVKSIHKYSLMNQFLAFFKCF